MADPAPGLAEGHPIAGERYEDGDPTLLSMTPVNAIPRFSLRVASSDIAAASEALGLTLPDAIGRCSAAGGRRALCLGPDEWYLTVAIGARAPAPAAAAADLAQRMRPILHSLVDISDRDIGIDVSGRAAAEVLSSGCPLDLWQMAPDHGARTVFERAQIVVFKPAIDAFQIAVGRSFAPYVWAILTRSARQNAAIRAHGRSLG